MNDHDVQIDGEPAVPEDLEELTEEERLENLRAAIDRALSPPEPEDHPEHAGQSDQRLRRAIDRGFNRPAASPSTDGNEQ